MLLACSLVLYALTFPMIPRVGPFAKKNIKTKLFCTLLDKEMIALNYTKSWSCLICISQVAYLKRDVPLVALWLRITRVQSVQLYQEKGNYTALQNKCVWFPLLN